MKLRFRVVAIAVVGLVNSQGREDPGTETTRSHALRLPGTGAGWRLASIPPGEERPGNAAAVSESHGVYRGHAQALRSPKQQGPETSRQRRPNLRIIRVAPSGRIPGFASIDPAQEESGRFSCKNGTKIPYATIIRIGSIGIQNESWFLTLELHHGCQHRRAQGDLPAERCEIS
jgi:hypothetical protein